MTQKISMCLRAPLTWLTGSFSRSMNITGHLSRKLKTEERVTPSQIHHHSTSSSESASCSPAMVCVYEGPQELWAPPSQDENVLWKLSKCCSKLSLCTLLLETELTTLPQHLQSCYYEKPRNKTHGRVCAGFITYLTKGTRASVDYTTQGAVYRKTHIFYQFPFSHQN